MNIKKEWSVQHFSSLASTNDYAKEKRAERKNLIVTADRQTAGRGTKGRSFSSADGGIYLSKFEFYENFPSSESFKIMIGAAASVCETLEFFGLKPVIKWPNDLHVNGKKICGILIENTFGKNTIINSVVGIGVNVNNTFEEELKDIAISMQEATGKTFDVKSVKEKLIERLLSQHEIEDYRKYLGYMGKEVEMYIGDECVPATLLFVDEQGGLWIRVFGEERRVCAGEVKIKL